MNIPLPRLPKGSCFLPLAFLVTGSAYAQNGPDLTDGCSFKHYTDENGLPQNSVKDIAPDLEGFVWLTTENGLVRFDGRRFKVFNKSNLDISTNRLTWFQPSMQKRSNHLYALTSNMDFFRIQGGQVFRDNQYVARILDVREGLLKILLPVSGPGIQRTALTPPKYK
ncbi:hypothetical protein [Dyadobacter sp. LHD-138]|uniref:hypothetical protein n=1 Tax=Dyadobacter sp. LHD-138 TaxID=3071413 RepID=UPI0027DF9FBA|nr:hypothetical protein [Dyadobacter sp. LHD-138]MDQ6478068.1 hypothetical protein [Dyadobacter sp. LHD-138]